METTANKNTSTLLQLSSLSQYFFPFGNFIFPVLIWSLKKQESQFVDYNGKQAINFQLSILLYTVVIGAVAIPLIIYLALNNISFNFSNNWGWIIKEVSAGHISYMVLTGIIATALFFMLKVFEFSLVLYAAVKNSNGESYAYPLSIKFLK